MGRWIGRALFDSVRALVAMRFRIQLDGFLRCNDGTCC